MGRINDKGLKLIRESEGCVLKVYPDPATKGRPYTAGCGHAGLDIQKMKIGDKITQEQADEWLRLDIASTEVAVDSFCKGAKLNSNQFSALVCFAFNVGSWRSTQLFKKIAANRLGEAALLFPNYNHAAGKVLKGLTIRRAAEQELFNTPEETA